MKAINDLIKKNPVLSYFLLTFAISWGAILVLIALNGMPATMAEANAQLPVAIMTFLLGPCISGLVMMLMHFSLTACSIAFSPAAMSGWQVFIYGLSVGAAVWLLAGVVTAVNWKQFSRS